MIKRVKNPIKCVCVTIILLILVLSSDVLMFMVFRSNSTSRNGFSSYLNNITQNLDLSANMETVNIPEPRPFVGARDENGNLGYIFDPSPLRFAKYVNTSEIKKYTNRPEKAQQIPILPKFQDGLKKSRKFLSELPKEKVPKIMCIVYTYDKDHDVLEAIRNTWANDCDGFFAASNKTDESLGAVDLIHRGEEAYQNMWQKTRSILNYAHDYFLDKYDFFYLCGVDMFVLVDNLRAYLASDMYLRYNDGYRDEFSSRDDVFPQAKNSSKLRPRPLLIGMPFRINGVLPSGGSGYALNRAALELFVHLDKTTSNTDIRWNKTTSQEDFQVGNIFRDQGVIVTNTQDEAGGWRLFGSCIESMHKFNGLSPLRLRLTERVFKVKASRDMDAFSAQIVSLHLKGCDDSAIETIYRYQSFFV